MKGSQPGGILTLFRCQRRKFLMSKALTGILTLPLGASPVLPEEWNLSMGIRTCGIHRGRGGVTKYNAPAMASSVLTFGSRYHDTKEKIKDNSGITSTSVASVINIGIIDIDIIIVVIS